MLQPVLYANAAAPRRYPGSATASNHANRVPRKWFTVVANRIQHQPLQVHHLMYLGISVIVITKTSDTDISWFLESNISQNILVICKIFICNHWNMWCSQKMFIMYILAPIIHRRKTATVCIIKQINNGVYCVNFSSIIITGEVLHTYNQYVIYIYKYTVQCLNSDKPL